MNIDEYQNEIVVRVQSLYAQLACRPHMFAGRPGCIEAFVLAVESFLDGLNSKPRENSYSRFCSSEGFGAERFALRFERLHDCRLGFIPKEQREVVAIAEEIEADFQAQFEGHWTKFLQWRERYHSVE